MIDTFKWIYNNPLSTLSIIGIYLGIGFLWSLVKTYTYGRKYLHYYKDQLNKYKTETEVVLNNLTSKIDSYAKSNYSLNLSKIDQAQVELLTEQMNQLKNGIIPVNYSMKMKKPTREYIKSSLPLWIIWWWVSMINYVIDDMIINFINWVYDTFGFVYERILKFSMRGI